MSKIAMMFKIVALLQTYYMISAGRLGELLETSPRNIKAYIESLRMEGVPIEGMSGKNGGYYLSKDYEFRPPGLDEVEYSALLLAEEFLNKTNGFTYEHEIKTAFAKIKVAQGKVIDTSHPTDQSDFADSRGKADITKKTGDYLRTIQQAILHRNSIRIDYNNPIKKQSTVRKLDPYNLIFRDSSWYVIGYCHLRETIRMFKLMRIEGIEVLTDTYKIKDDYSPHTYLQDTFTLIKGKQRKVEIQFYHPASVWVSEKLWLPTQKIIARKDGSIIFRARVDGLEEIKKWVLGFGRLARVIKPQELADQIVQETCEVQKLYAKPEDSQKNSREKDGPQRIDPVKGQEDQEKI
ncbi:WYL domain-containing protein [Eubacteriales bacterium mix99]